ncbi:MAG TPA: signal peptidase I [Anaerolinea thermolimosa]|uniref:Signal peptidase I n=1 Tax=Anaerolinea thermolimosa TaxID=229919 RepID=A0A3D1JIZ2_9CHLR|nr:signal peptidase I [Anaerolinea thermolimosa]GAP05446.1 signal peptidase I, bacterial type [Anaerolinea thermolimosa]HCE18197.1 signal peptidase I [Anaerolinea thermolimosa]
MESFRSEPLPNEEPTRPAPRRNPVISFLLETIQTILMALVLYFLIDLVLGRVRVENISMEPTVRPGQFILVNKLAYRLGEFKRGDVIIFHYPRDPHEDYIKRVVGLPGETVTIRDGRVYINGQPLDEPYISAPPQYTGEWVVPEDQVFVLGDNRNQSSDSHSWGFVPRNLVVGRALVVYWPLNDIKILNQTPVVNAAN